MSLKIKLDERLNRTIKISDTNMRIPNENNNTWREKNE